MSGPVSRYSRNLFCTGQLDAEGNLFLSERVPLRYAAQADDVEYVAGAGDTWSSLAYAFLNGLPDPATLWWVIADYQPEPVVDPTIAILPGTTLYIPSIQTVETLVFNESRRLEFQA